MKKIFTAISSVFESTADVAKNSADIINLGVSYGKDAIIDESIKRDITSAKELFETTQASNISQEQMNTINALRNAKSTGTAYNPVETKEAK